MRGNPAVVGRVWSNARASISPAPKLLNLHNPDEHLLAFAAQTDAQIISPANPAARRPVGLKNAQQAIAKRSPRRTDPAVQRQPRGRHLDLNPDKSAQCSNEQLQCSKHSRRTAALTPAGPKPKDERSATAANAEQLLQPRQRRVGASAADRQPTTPVC